MQEIISVALTGDDVPSRDEKILPKTVTRRTLCLSGVAALGSLTARPGSATASETRRPNILWISCEDTSPDRLGCYGSRIARTPNLDRLAASGVRYDRAFSTSGVCAPTRSTIITGMYATSLGSHHMRSTIRLPPPVRCFTEYLRQEGYFCTNNAKTDYNFAVPDDAWDELGPRAHWRQRPPGVPFFSVFNFQHTHEFQPRLAPDDYAARTQRLQPEDRQRPELQKIPPYYPDERAVREEWARTMELTTAVDYEAGDLLQQLRQDRLIGDTIVFFWGDHGNGLPRAKRWLYDSGCRVPLIVSIPEKFRQPAQGLPGTVERELVSFVDLAPTVLNLAGVPPPQHMQGRAFLGPRLTAKRSYVYGTHDRQDERYEMVRMVRDRRYKYLRNYQPGKPYYQRMNSSEGSATMQALRRGYANGSLPPAAQQYMVPRKPPEELYDMVADPHELCNLAGSQTYEPALRRLRDAHRQWLLETRDLGWIPEPELYEQERLGGFRQDLLLGDDGKNLLLKLQEVVQARETGNQQLLAEAALHGHPVVRCWSLPVLKCNEILREAMRSRISSVRIAAAQGGLRSGLGEESSALLAAELDADDEWVRLLAANALDGAGEYARPHIANLRKALTDPRNQTRYVARVVNQTLNDLLETANQVP